MSKKIQILKIACVVLFLVLSMSCNTTEFVYETVIQAIHAESGHADSSSEAFRHWDEDDPPLVSASCAKCHSTGGFLDFLDNGVVDNDAPNNTTIECEVCHSNPDTGTVRSITTVTFPSGITLENLGNEGICMQCHQGRYSAKGVNDYLAGKDEGGGEDGVNAGLGFRNIHYLPVGATLHGTLAKGGYEYSGKTYDGKFSHVEGYTSCTDCHNPHSLEIKTERCTTCHAQVNGDNTLHDIRYYGSFTDYDGDGDITEGIYYEIESMKKYLYDAIQAYGTQVSKKAIGYESHSYPYFFNDTNGDGTISEAEANYGNQYKSWTPRLIKAAYNYQMAKKDPGAFAHGGKYILQLLYDSLEDLNSALKKVKKSTANLHRGDEGHFDGSGEAWRHWDEDGEVSGRCARCHSATGLATYIETGENEEAEPIANGMLCTTCHTSPPSMRTIAEVEFPSGAKADLGDSSNLCLACHQGRASGQSVKDKVKGEAPYSFTNVHYFPAAAVFFGTDVKGGYEYSGKKYVGQKMFPNHNGKFDTCVQCHMGTMGAASDHNHNVHKPNPADCVYCHGQDVSQPNRGANPDLFKFSGIRPSTTPDYDGDGDTSESIQSEIQGLEAELYARMQAKGNIVYDSHSYPYWFFDTNGNGISDGEEATRANAYMFSAPMLKAAYNYQLSLKEPHGFIHNSKYIAQLLVDSIVNLGGKASTYKWRK